MLKGSRSGPSESSSAPSDSTTAAPSDSTTAEPSDSTTAEPSDSTTAEPAARSAGDSSGADPVSPSSADDGDPPRQQRSPTQTGRGDDDGSSRRSTLARSGQALKRGSDLIRSRIASVVWLVAVLAAVVLAVGALLYALDANMKNDIVKGVLNLAATIDGPFWRIFEFFQDKKGAGGKQVHDATKEHLVNWGLAAVAYLVVGRILDRVIRP